MAEQILTIPRTSDKTILNTFKEIGEYLGGIAGSATFTLFGSENESINPANYESNEILATLSSSRNSSLIYTVSWNVQSFVFYYYRGGNAAPKSPYTDSIVIRSDNNTKLASEHKLAIAQILIKNFKAFEPGRIVGGKRSKEEEELYSLQEASFKNLRELNEELTVKNHEFRHQLEGDFELKKQEAEKHYKKKTDDLESEYAQKQETLDADKKAFEAKVKELDSRTNTHARRQIRKDIIKEIKDRQTNFSLTQGTNKLRYPIAIAMVCLVLFLAYLTIFAARDFLQILSNPDSTTLIIIVASVKQLLYSFGAIASILYFIKWQNRWFEQHATAEFHLKQLELDMERASWLVETSLEWNDAKGETIPTELLESLSRNLFSNSQDDIEKVVHPADELASAIIGSSSMVKLKAGNAELQIDPQKLKKSKKEIPVETE